MMITANEVRELGFKRIWKIATDNGNSAKLFEDLNKMALLLSGVRIVPYSALSVFSSYAVLSGEECGGLVRCMLDVAPFIEQVEPDGMSKQKFRNLWDNVWQKFGEACELREFEVSALSEIGLKLPLLLAALEHKDEKAVKMLKSMENYYAAFGLEVNAPIQGKHIYEQSTTIRNLCTFYNMVLGWQLSVQNESDMTSLVTYLAVTDFGQFREFFSSGKRVWVSNADLRIRENTDAMPTISLTE